MGTQVQSKSYLPGYLSMRDLNEDSNSGSWPLFYGDKSLTNGHYYNGYLPRTTTDACQGYDKDAVKQKMLEHEAIFRNQVYELHRLYRVQRDMMEEVKIRELHKQRTSIEPSSSSTHLGSQIPSEDARKWHITSFPMVSSGYGRPSLSAAEIMSSPLSSTKGDNKQDGRFPFRNGSTSKDCEMLDARPSKVRKKLFDLHLPADEYIDTEETEHVQDSKISDMLCYTSNGTPKIAPESSVKLFLGGVAAGKNDCHKDSATSGSSLRSSVGLADLNEPVQAEEATGPSAIDGHPFNHDKRIMDLSTKPNSGFLTLPKETMRNLQGGHDGSLNILSVESKGREHEWPSYMSGAGKSNLNSVSQGLLQDKFFIPSFPAQVMVDKPYQPPGVYTNEPRREDLWMERTSRVFETSDRIHDHHKYSSLEPAPVSKIPNSYSFAATSDGVNSWSSWGKPVSNLTQKMPSFDTQPSLNSPEIMGRNPPLSAQSNGIFGDKWLVSGSSKSNPGGGSDLLNKNGFYHGSSSGAKEQSAHLASTGFDYLNCNKIDNIASEHSINRVNDEYLKGSNSTDWQIDASFVLAKKSSHAAVPQKNLNVVDDKTKPVDHLGVLPWLKAKPVCQNEASNNKGHVDSANLGILQDSSMFCKKDTVGDLNQSFTGYELSASSECAVVPENGMGQTKIVKKILGFPILENPSASKNDSSSLASTATRHCLLGGEQRRIEGKRNIIDINVACDPALLESDEQINEEEFNTEKTTDTKGISVRNHFDLNFCVSEDEDPSGPSNASNNTSFKIAMEIDLEAPVIAEAEEDILPGEAPKQHPVPTLEQTHDLIVKGAAEAIVSISSATEQINVEDISGRPSEGSLEVSLLWFVNAVSSCADELEGKSDLALRGKDVSSKEDSSSDEMDDFEAMTLRLEETKEEDYMPNPFVPEIQKVEETGASSVPSRPRRGQARRGRQRRDFQRDILPGLASLSRHEVTEDLQIFGGLMRATGHPWNAGLTRRSGTRNGGGRGRRRTVVDTAQAAVAAPSGTALMQQLNNVESGLDERSLTGWGKTTRRPRRQRCPAGNPPTVTLT